MYFIQHIYVWNGTEGPSVQSSDVSISEDLTSPDLQISQNAVSDVCHEQNWHKKPEPIPKITESITI